MLIQRIKSSSLFVPKMNSVIAFNNDVFPPAFTKKGYFTDLRIILFQHLAYNRPQFIQKG